MQYVVLFFPDTKKLADYSVLLNKGAVEISSRQLTMTALLSDDEIAEAVLFYEATPCSAHTWSQLEQWLDNCRRSQPPKAIWHFRARN